MREPFSRTYYCSFSVRHLVRCFPHVRVSATLNVCCCQGRWHLCCRRYYRGRVHRRRSLKFCVDIVIRIMGRACRIRYSVGDMVTFRSAIIMHKIMPFTGQWSAVVLFSKWDVIKWIQRRERPSRPWASKAEELETDLEEEHRARARTAVFKMQLQQWLEGRGVAPLEVGTLVIRTSAPVCISVNQFIDQKHALHDLEHK
jgi:hypothetical protein